MNITILNGNPEGANHRFDTYLDELSRTLQEKGHSITLYRLRDLYLSYCIGCWGCWCKKPGECIVPDDTAQICRSYINSNFVLFASPVIMGFTSALLKMANDKLIPLIHPYFEVSHGEIHHRKRYRSYPYTGLLLEKGADCDDEDVTIIGDIYARNAINLKTRLKFVKLTETPVTEVANAIDHI